jgi:type III restriction enzyme
MASFLESRYADVVSFAKNTMGESGVNFSIEYQKEDGNIASYFPDFFVKTATNTFFILETKGREDLDDIRKIKRLATWCKDINAIQTDYTYTPVYVKQEKWDDVKKDIKTFAELCLIFEVV